MPADRGGQKNADVVATDCCPDDPPIFVTRPSRDIDDGRWEANESVCTGVASIEGVLATDTATGGGFGGLVLDVLEMSPVSEADNPREKGIDDKPFKT